VAPIRSNFSEMPAGCPDSFMNTAGVRPSSGAASRGVEKQRAHLRAFFDNGSVLVIDFFRRPDKLGAWRAS
jgi:hypothetical protein